MVTRTTTVTVEMFLDAEKRVNQYNLRGNRRDKTIHRSKLGDVLKCDDGDPKVDPSSDPEVNVYVLKKYIRRQIKHHEKEDDVQRELRLCAELEHPNIINAVEILDDPNEECIYMVLPYYQRGPILEWDPQKK